MIILARHLAATWKLAGNHGLGWLAARLAYEAQVRSGFQKRRFRRRLWLDNELAHWLRLDVPADPDGYAAYRRQHSPEFFFRAADRPAYQPVLLQILGQPGCQELVNSADQLGRGRFRYFFTRAGGLGLPLDWYRNPFTDQRVSPVDHWSRIPVFSPETGDLKVIWEPGRFASAFALARAYWVSGDEAHAETFWQLVESWIGANPPNHGAHWRCGQEIALRLMAWCFALYAFAGSPATTPERLVLMVGAIAAQADRIARGHTYARLQRNNHAISEGMGLWTVGILFPELRAAGAWREAGRRMLEEEAGRQIYADGAYVQHSTNYHRLMLHDYTWSIRLGEVSGCELSSNLRERVRKASEFLYQLQDGGSGGVPNYGANDGALILPLNSCGYTDFRPVLGSVHYLFEGMQLYPPGPWDEDLVWLFGPEALESGEVQVERTPWRASEGGYYTLRGGRSWGMIRCATLRDRPSQADMLHLDIWRDGVNVACDPGTFSYYAEPPWDNGLVSTRVHNTVSVDGADQMERGPHFLWLTWLKSRLRHYLVSEEGHLVYFEGTHDGYERLPQPVSHRRGVLKAGEDVWVVVDDLLGKGEHDLRLHWLLNDFPFEVDDGRMRVALSVGDGRYGLSMSLCLPEAVRARFDVLRGTENSVPRGWQSHYYGVRQPALSTMLCSRAVPPCRFISVFAPEAPGNLLAVSAAQVCFESDGSTVTANLLAPGSSSIVHDVVLDRSSVRDRLVVG